MPLGSAQNQDQRHTDQIGRQSCQHDLCTSMKNTSTVSPDNPTVNPVIKVTPTLYIPSRTAKIPTQKSLAPSIFGMETGIVMMFFSVSWVDSLSISQLPIITSEIGKTSAYCPRQHSQTEWKIIVWISVLRLHNQLAPILHQRTECKRHQPHPKYLAPA